MNTARRHALGICALVMVCAGFVLLAENDWKTSADSDTMWASILLRAGFTMGAIWLAFPQLVRLFSKVPVWVIGLFVVGGIVLVARPKLFVVVLPLLGVLAALQFVKWLFKPLPNQASRKGKPREHSSNKTNS